MATIASEQAPSERVRSSVRTTVLAYVALTKPRIIELLLVTTLPVMMLAAHGLPRLELVAATLVGGTLAAGAANALNCYVDRDIDAVMHRTSKRPLVGTTMRPGHALTFGLILAALSVVLLWVTTNPLSGLLALAAIGFYVVVYTMLLKRRTSSNIVWGGAAGCMPVLIGWSAVTGSIGWPPVVLFLVVFLWTPPHFWALAMQCKDDYAAAGVPMLPVVATPTVVVHRMILYTWAMVIASLLLWPLGHTSVLYPVAAAVLGAAFLREAYLLRGRIRAGKPPHPARLFHWSINYLTLLFVAVAVSAVIPQF